MQTKTLHSWFSLPKMWLWTWPMWWFRSHDPRNDDERDVAAIKYALDKWITHFDTAELYGAWAAEKILGKAIEWYDREKIQIASKVMGSMCSYEDIKIACKKSIERLEIDYLDLYYIHRREAQFDLKDCMKALNELVEEWLIKNIGVSNFSVKTMIEAQSYSKHKIVANQVHYNLIYRECCVDIDWGWPLLDYCQRNDILLVAYRPLELWKLANYWWAELVDMWIKYDKTHAQMALNYINEQENVVSIFKSSDLKHIDENLWSLWWKFDDEDLDVLTKWNRKTVYVSDCITLK